MVSKKLLFAILAGCLSAYFIFFKAVENVEYVNVYGWYGIIPRDVIEQFEKENKVIVRYDVFDNNDILEAKLLATNCGYDVVFPSFIPYGSRQASIGVYQKIDQDSVSNLKNIDDFVAKKFEQSNGDMEYLIPYFWGTIGIAFNKDVVEKVLPDLDPYSYDIIFDPENLKKLSKFGVCFPEEFVDIFPLVKFYLDIDQDDSNFKTLKKIKSFFKPIRPYITKFSSSTMIQDLAAGNLCVAICPSDNAWRAMVRGNEVGKNIRFIIPKEKTTMWIDCLGIPSGAPNPKNALKFVNFLLRKDIATRITNHSGILTTIKDLDKYVDKSIKSAKSIFPRSKRLLDLLYVSKTGISDDQMKYEQMAIKTWTQIKLNLFETKSKAESQ